MTLGFAMLRVLLNFLRVTVALENKMPHRSIALISYSPLRNVCVFKYIDVLAVIQCFFYFLWCCQIPPPPPSHCPPPLSFCIHAWLSCFVQLSKVIIASPIAKPAQPAAIRFDSSLFTVRYVSNNTVYSCSLS